MRGRLKQTLVVTGLLELADTLAYWSSLPGSSAISGIVTSYGPVLTSVVIRIIGATALVFVLTSLRKGTMGINPKQFLQVPGPIPS
jgi:hypothetical protein